MAGDDGARHRLLGTWSDTPAPSVRAFAAKSTMGTFEGASIEEMGSAHASVAPALMVVAMAAAGQPVPQDESIGAKELNDMQIPSDLHEETQKLIYRVMLYHMTDDDRKKFLGVFQPLVNADAGDGVPAELGPNIESGLKIWIQEKYIPAWLAQRLSAIGDTSKELFRQSLTPQQRKKLRYWWEGKGSDCMSKDDYYSRLNEMAAQFTLSRLLPRLKAYKQDPFEGTTQPPPNSSKVATKGLNGGKRWAVALYNRYAVGPAMTDLAMNLGTMTSSVRISITLFPPLPPQLVLYQGFEGTNLQLTGFQSSPKLGKQ